MLKFEEMLEVESETKEAVQKAIKELQSSGSKREFPTGATRDSAENKPRMELLPYDLLERVAIHYGLGAEKYGSNNWRKGQPASVVIGSLHRHLSKIIKGDTTEDHYAAVVWNALALMNVDEYYKENPLINDVGDWFIDNVPTGNGDYKEKNDN